MPIFCISLLLTMDYFTQLPHELKLTIFGWLDVETRINASCVCKDWNTIIKSRKMLRIRKILFPSQLTLNDVSKIVKLQPNVVVLGKSFRMPYNVYNNEHAIKQHFKNVEILTINTSDTWWESIPAEQVLSLFPNLKNIRIIYSCHYTFYCVLQYLEKNKCKVEKMTLVYKGPNLASHIEGLKLAINWWFYCGVSSISTYLKFFYANIIDDYAEATRLELTKKFNFETKRATFCLESFMNIGLGIIDKNINLTIVLFILLLISESLKYCKKIA